MSCRRSSSRRRLAATRGSRISACLTGLEIRDEDANVLLMRQKRETLISTFARRGYRTLAMMPGLQQSWPEGHFLRLQCHLRRRASRLQGAAVRLVDDPRSVRRGAPRCRGDRAAVARAAVRVLPHHRHAYALHADGALSARLGADADAAAVRTGRLLHALVATAGLDEPRAKLRAGAGGDLHVDRRPAPQARRSRPRPDSDRRPPAAGARERRRRHLGRAGSRDREPHDPPRGARRVAIARIPERADPATSEAIADARAGTDTARRLQRRRSYPQAFTAVRRQDRAAAVHTSTGSGSSRPCGVQRTGYRVYRDADFARLEQIVVLKCLGLPLRDIGPLLRKGANLKDVLRRQRKVLAARHRQIEAAINAIERAERSLYGAREPDWTLFTLVVKEIAMQDDSDWTKKYYSDDAHAKVEERKPRWSPELQEKVSRQWSELIADVETAVRLGEDPSGAMAQSLAARWKESPPFHRRRPGRSAGLEQDVGGSRQLAGGRAKNFRMPAEVTKFIMKAMGTRSGGSAVG